MGIISLYRDSGFHGIIPDRLGGHLRAWEAFVPLELVQGSEAGSLGL